MFQKLVPVSNASFDQHVRFSNSIFFQGQCISTVIVVIVVFEVLHLREHVGAEVDLVLF